MSKLKRLTLRLGVQLRVASQFTFVGGLEAAMYNASPPTQIRWSNEMLLKKP